MLAVAQPSPLSKLKDKRKRRQASSKKLNQKHCHSSNASNIESMSPWSVEATGLL